MEANFVSKKIPMYSTFQLHILVYWNSKQTPKLLNPLLLKFFTGVLLHGPPGCGKTLLAKATAREAGTNFINLEVSLLTDKWYGESQKIAAAVFTLATKLQPCIIFIDEIGKFL